MMVSQKHKADEQPWLSVPRPPTAGCDLGSFARLLADSALSKPFPLLPTTPEVDALCALMPNDDIRLALLSSPLTVLFRGGKSSTLLGVTCGPI